MFKTLLLACVYLLLIGCATSAVPTPDVSYTRDKTQSSPLQQAQAGQSVTVEGQSATVLEEYVAASGRSCKTLLIHTNQVTRVACRKPAGEWYIRKPLQQNTHRPGAKFVSQLNEPLTVEIAAPAKKQVAANQQRYVAVIKDENLWRFSKRVTGNALNWERIAEFNKIDDVTTLNTGTRLAIPPEIAILPGAG